jgi:hypothetical protein
VRLVEHGRELEVRGELAVHRRRRGRESGAALGVTAEETIEESHQLPALLRRSPEIARELHLSGVLGRVRDGEHE